MVAAGGQDIGCAGSAATVAGDVQTVKVAQVVALRATNLVLPAQLAHWT